MGFFKILFAVSLSALIVTFYSLIWDLVKRVGKIVPAEFIILSIPLYGIKAMS